MYEEKQQEREKTKQQAKENCLVCSAADFPSGGEIKIDQRNRMKKTNNINEAENVKCSLNRGSVATMHICCLLLFR